MSDCRTLEPLLTPYVDGETPPVDRAAIDAHLRACGACASRVAAERAVRTLIRSRRVALARECASSTLRARCTAAARREGAATVHPMPGGARAVTWRHRLMPLALAASLTLIVGGAFLYEATSRSSRVMAAELAADHVKCFAANRVVGARHAPIAAASRYLASSFGWQAHLPTIAGLDFEGARPCLYGEGRVAHVMYRYGGRPVSLFMLPGTARQDELVEVLGHEAAIWSVDGRTFVLIARQSRDEVSRLVAAIQRDVR